MLRTDTEIRDTTDDYPESRAGVADGEEWLRKNAPKAPARQVSPGTQQQGSDLMKQVIDTIYAKRGHPNPATAASPSIAPDLHQPEQVVPPNLDDLDKAHPIQWTRNEPAEMPMPPVPPPEETAQREMPAPPIPPPEPETPRKPMAGAGGDGAPEAFASDVPPPDAGQTPQEIQKSKLKHITAAYMPRAEPDGTSPQASGVPVGTATSDREARLKAALEASAQARSGNGLSGVASRFVEDATNLRGKRKPDYGIAASYDAQDEARANRPLQAYAMDEQARTADRDARVKEATLALAQQKANKPDENDALATAKFNAQWKLDHPDAAKPPAERAPSLVELDKARIDVLKNPPVKAAPQARPMSDDAVAVKRMGFKKDLNKQAEEVANMAQLLNEAERQVPGITTGMPNNPDDVPDRRNIALAGLPAGAGQAWNDFTGNQSANNYAQIRNGIKQARALAISGKVLNQSELATIDNFLAAGPLAPPALYAQALRILSTAKDRAAAGLRAEFGPTGAAGNEKFAVYDEYMGEHPEMAKILGYKAPGGGGPSDPSGGATPDHTRPPRADWQGKPGDPVPDPGPGSNLGVAPVPKPDAGIVMRGGRRFRKLPDGNYEEVG